MGTIDIKDVYKLCHCTVYLETDVFCCELCAGRAEGGLVYVGIQLSKHYVIYNESSRMCSCM